MKKLNWFRVVAVVIVVLIIGFGIKFGWSKFKPEAKTDAYYAVFLTNNQVYFGHLADKTDQYLSLTDIYYLQLAQPLQSTDAKDQTALQDNSKQQLTLIKLGKELHGPKDKMVINRDNIIFYEEINNDSKVVQTITKYKESQPK